MSALPPNKGTAAAIVSAILLAMNSPSALATGTRIHFEPADRPAETASKSIHRTAKGDYWDQKSTRTVDPKDMWATSEPKTGKDEGTATDKLYRSLKELGLSPQKEIIVAVIDSGVDIDHEDLKGKIWVNAGETGTDANGRDKASNGEDDDKDGYIDDVYGWNFLGSVQDGKIQNVGPNSLEVARELGKIERIAAMRALTADEAAYKVELEKDYQIKSTVYSGINMDKTYNGSEIIRDNPEKLEPVCASASVGRSADCVRTSYGNNDVKGRQTDPNAHAANPSAAELGKVMDKHGTHVSGIIAAIRDNVDAENKPVGMQGQASNVKIMPIRAVPDGDERDKDIANAIRFAVDHGASIINGSFGKSFSPQKSWVDDAIRYAQSKGVMFVHAAGNSGASNEDSGSGQYKRYGNFPNQFHYNAEGQLTGAAPNWIEVGAATRSTTPFMSNYGPQTLIASFSNYGKKSVDLFAPGFKIASTVPEKDQYAVLSGTSMASPETAGVAALLWSLFPQADYSLIRKAMISKTTQYAGLEVTRPTNENDHTGGGSVLFSELSVAGGIVNAYESAVYLKEELAKPVARPALTDHYWPKTDGTISQRWHSKSKGKVRGRNPAKT
jgi:cell wall-associated protease